MCARSLRFRLLLLFSLLLWPIALLAASQTVLPVVRNMSGSVVVQAADGSQHEVIQSVILHPGDIVSTGPNSRAAVEVADVGSVVIGPTSAALARSDGSNLWLQMSAGMLCLQSDTSAVGVRAGSVNVNVVTPPAIFDILRDAGDTTIAVYQGSVAVTRVHEATLTASSGQAVRSLNDGQLVQAPFSNSLHTFDSLGCPDRKVVASALSHAPPAQAIAESSVTSTTSASAVSQGHSGGGGVLGWLLGLAAIGAAAAGHGGGATANNSSSNPTVDAPTPEPTMTPTSTPSASPSPSASPTPKPSVTPSPSITPSPGPLVVSQSSVNIDGLGNTQTFQASESHYSGPINASSSNNGVVSVTPSIGEGTVTFSVQSNGVGNANIVVSDDHSGQQQVFASVVVGSITLTPQTLSFASPGSDSQNFEAQDPHSRGYSAVSSNPSVASVEQQGGAFARHDHKTTFSVSPVGVGTATIFVSDDAGSQAAVSVGVSAAPLWKERHEVARPQMRPLTVSSESVVFAGHLGVQTIAIWEPGYSGIFAVRSLNQSVASVSPPNCAGPRCLVSVSALAAGSTRISISDDRGSQRIVEVIVNLPVMRKHERH